MKWIAGIYLIVGAVICWLWADGPLYAVGITIGDRDLMGYVIPVIFLANLSVGAGLLVNRTR